MRLAALVLDAAQGSTVAFEAFYDATVAYAQTLARRIVGPDESDDVLADAYFQAWRTAARFDAGRGSAMSWLLTMVHSRAIDTLRQRGPRCGSDDAEQVEELATPDADPAQALWQAQAGSRLDAALRQLDPAERWVLALAYYRDLSHSAIADATGMPLGTVKSHIARAQAKLRRALEG